jgi:hypothetical protein
LRRPRAEPTTGCEHAPDAPGPSLCRPRSSAHRPVPAITERRSRPCPRAPVEGPRAGIVLGPRDWADVTIDLRGALPLRRRWCELDGHGRCWCSLLRAARDGDARRRGAVTGRASAGARRLGCVAFAEHPVFDELCLWSLARRNGRLRCGSSRPLPSARQACDQPCSLVPKEMTTRGREVRRRRPPDRQGRAACPLRTCRRRHRLRRATPGGKSRQGSEPRPERRARNNAGAAQSCVRARSRRAGSSTSRSVPVARGPCGGETVLSVARCARTAARGAISASGSSGRIGAGRRPLSTSTALARTSLSIQSRCRDAGSRSTRSNRTCS